MIEEHADLWTGFARGANAVCITTNGFVKKNGECVMGRGCAKEAAAKYSDLPARLGALIREAGNHVHLLPYGLVSFPVKHNWFEEADPALIRRSARELVYLAASLSWQSVWLPRPGCGNGKLLWDDVRPELEDFLDDRFTVVTW